MASPSAAARPTAPPILHSTAPRTAPPVALRVEALRKSYGTFEAVKGISFEIHAGEVFGLLGPNGAGKTTTISLLATRLRPSGGDAKLFDGSILRDVAHVRRAIGLVPQEIALYPTLTGAENVRFFGRMYGVPKELLEPRIDELLQLVGLDGRRHDRAGTYSGGMKRRLNLAVSLVHDPGLLLLDEPTAGVDPHSRERIFQIVRDLRQRGTAILYTTHYMEEAELLCDRVGIMDEGSIVAAGTLAELLSGSGCTETIRVRGLPAADVARRLGKHPAVVRVETDGDTCRLFVTRATTLLEPLQRLIGDAAERVGVQIEPMSLENLFLHLTGKELRD